MVQIDDCWNGANVYIPSPALFFLITACIGALMPVFSAPRLSPSFQLI